jgi:hypothetical protein
MSGLLAMLGWTSTKKVESTQLKPRPPTDRRDLSVPVRNVRIEGGVVVVHYKLGGLRLAPVCHLQLRSGAVELRQRRANVAVWTSFEKLFENEKMRVSTRRPGLRHRRLRLLVADTRSLPGSTSLHQSQRLVTHRPFPRFP